MARSRVTIRDVAAQARVSHQTVSRVINDSQRVRPATRARVETAIAELGYRPNAIARFMARGRTGSLACLAPNLIDYTFASIIEGAQIEARAQGFFLLSASAPDEATFASLVDQLVDSRRTEGLMVINPYADGRYALLPHPFPTVFIGARPRAEAADSVALDDVAVAQQAAQHLLELGHRRLGMLTGPLVEDCAQDRSAGFHETLNAAGLTAEPAWVLEGDWSATSGYGALLQLAAAGPLPQAIFAQNDRMAVGILRAARDLGLRIPDELSVIGVDDIPLAAYFAPPLTTMRQDFIAIGREAARLLIHAVAEPEAPRRHLRLPAELVVRRSTAVAQSAPNSEA
jgi:DNA-binding LacI/PurR family transcriptional regulator